MMLPLLVSVRRRTQGVTNAAELTETHTVTYYMVAPDTHPRAGLAFEDVRLCGKGVWQSAT